jgi:hypothetical protein
MSDYINIDNIKDIREENNISKFEETIYYDSILEVEDQESNNIIYQVQPVFLSNKSIIKSIGTSVVRPSILIKKFKFKGYHCELVSLVLNEDDLITCNKQCFLPVISLIFTKKNSTRFTLSLEFHTFEHIKQKKEIKKLINTELDGFFAVYLKYYKNQKLIKEKLEIINNICNKQNLSYLLIKYISHEQVKKMIILQ